MENIPVVELDERVTVKAALRVAASLLLSNRLTVTGITEITGGSPEADQFIRNGYLYLARFFSGQDVHWVKVTDLCPNRFQQHPLLDFHEQPSQRCSLQVSEGQ